MKQTDEMVFRSYFDLMVAIERRLGLSPKEATEKVKKDFEEKFREFKKD